MGRTTRRSAARKSAANRRDRPRSLTSPAGSVRCTARGLVRWPGMFSLRSSGTRLQSCAQSVPNPGERGRVKRRPALAVPSMIAGARWLPPSSPALCRRSGADARSGPDRCRLPCVWRTARRSPPCSYSPPFPTAQASFTPVVVAVLCGEQQPRRECRLGDEAGAAPAPSWSRSSVLRMIV